MTKLTDAVAAKLTLPPGKTDHIEWDNAVPGFGLRLRLKASTAIALTWVFQYRSPTSGTTKRITFGSPTTLRAKDARDHAEHLHAQVKLGRDPQAEKQQARSRAKDSFAKVVDLYLATRKAQVDAGELRQSSFEQDRLALTRHCAGLNAHPICDVTQQQVARVLAGIKGRIAANRARSWLSHFFAWAVGEGIAAINPVANTNRPVKKEKPRTRVLSDAELAAVWRACGDDTYGAIIKLLALTGQRRDEIASLTWSELDLDAATWSIPGTRTKNHNDHVVPLSPQALEILRAVARTDRPYLFGAGKGGYRGFARAKTQLDKRIAAAWPADAKPFEPWVVHDLRRTAASGMARLGIALPVIEKALNHTSGSFAGIVGVYQHHEFSAEKRDALKRWAAHVAGLVDGTKANVHRLQRTA